MHRLLVSASFSTSISKDAVMTDAIRKLYESTVRIILVILHDFPEFLWITMHRSAMPYHHHVQPELGIVCIFHATADPFGCT